MLKGYDGLKQHVGSLTRDESHVRLVQTAAQVFLQAPTLLFMEPGEGGLLPLCCFGVKT